MNKFGKRIRELRNAKGYSLRQLAPLVGVGFTYLSKIETGKLDFGDVPSTELIIRLACRLEADEDSLLLLAGRIPKRIRDRILEKPVEFQKLASLNDTTLSKAAELINR